jgi:hypothetical protein
MWVDNREPYAASFDGAVPWNAMPVVCDNHFAGGGEADAGCAEFVWPAGEIADLSPRFPHRKRHM